MRKHQKIKLFNKKTGQKELGEELTMKIILGIVSRRHLNSLETKGHETLGTTNIHKSDTED